MNNNRLTVALPGSQCRSEEVDIESSNRRTAPSSLKKNAQRASTFLSMAVIVAFVVFGPVTAAQDAAANGEIWTGALDAGARVLRFRIEGIDDDSGVASHQLISLDEGNQAFKLDNFRLDKTQLSFELKRTKAKYSGTLSEDAATSTGKWSQSGKDFHLSFHRSATVPVDRPVESWTGTMTALFQKLQMRVRIYRDESGTETVFFDSVSQKQGGFKATRTIDGSEWTIDVTALGAGFKGTINSDKTEIVGTWSQSGLGFDLTLVPEKVIEVDVVPAIRRPQTPKAPFPYVVEDIKFENKVDGIELAGTLTIPKTNKPCPAVVMISGSGPQDRDESILEHKPFWVIADHLSRNGVAVLRFDDRETAESKGDFSKATSEDFANDAEAAFNYLAKDARISGRHIGLIGHSEGGLIAPIVAARRSDVAFIVLLAGPGVNGQEILLSQGRLVLEAEGINDKTALTTQRETQLAMFEAILKSPADSNVESLTNAAIKQLMDSLPEELRNEETLRPSIAAGIAQLNTPWFRNFLTFDPASVLQKVKCPVLALNGQKDVQVDPALNLPAIEAALVKGGNSQYRTMEFPSLNHLFQTCKTGGVSEYQTIEETISPVVLKTMTEWIAEHTSN